MHISLSPQHEAFVKAQVQSGKYSTNSDFIRDLIRRFQEREEKEYAFVRAKLEEAERSGTSTKTVDQILEETKERLHQDGKLPPNESR